MRPAFRAPNAVKPLKEITVLAMASVFCSIKAVLKNLIQKLTEAQPYSLSSLNVVKAALSTSYSSDINDR